MKLPVPKIAILALATCVGLIHKAESAANKEAAQKPMDVNRAEKSSGFETVNTHHGHHGHHHHNHCGHHPNKPEPEPEPESESCEQIDLICDRVVIDSITCPSAPRSTPLFMESVVPSDFEAANNDKKKKKCKNITSLRFVNMAFPCYNTPQECAPGPDPGDIIIDPFPIASQGDDTNDDTEEAGVMDELDVAGEDDDEDDIVEDDDGETPDGAQSLQKRNNDRKHHDRQNNKKHDHKNPQHHPRKKQGHKKIIHQKHPNKGGNQKHHNKGGNQKHHNKGGKQGGHKKDQHPWLGLCTSSGEFCGHGLFGCDFIWSGVYICSHVGAVPEFRGICSDGCENGGCTGGPYPPVTTDCPVTITTTTTTTDLGTTITCEPTTTTTTTTTTEPTDKTCTTTPTVTKTCTGTTTTTKTTGGEGCSTSTTTSTPTPTNTPPPGRCLCPANTTYCGVSLSALPGCKKVHADVIYDCTGGVDSEATELKRCSGTKKCIQYDTGAECVEESTNTCKCTEVGTFCGTSFDATLCKDLLTTGGTNTVYTCKKVGHAPEVTQACPARQLCLTKGNTAECGSSTCDCTGTTNLCSSEFKEACNLVANSIYSCSISGEPELVSTCEDNEQCVSLTEGAVCASNECRCPKIGTVCGVNFPSTCNLTATALYHCKEVDGKPKIREDCAPGKCVTASFASTADEAEEGMLDFQETTSDAGDTDRCILPCTCTSTEDVCGSRFGEDCKLNPNALHSCSGVGEVPEEKEICESGSCLVNPGADECASIEDPCICFKKGSFCGRTFARECEFDPERIYVCEAHRGTPMPFTNCTSGCDGTPLAVCNTELTTTTTTTGTSTTETTSTTNGTPTTTTTDDTVTTTQSSTTQTTTETTTDDTVTTTQSSTTQTTTETTTPTGPTSTTTTTTESTTTTTTSGPTAGTSTSTPPIDTTTTTTAGPTSETTTTTTGEVSSTTTTTGTEATTAATTTTTTTTTTDSTTDSTSTTGTEATTATTTTTTTAATTAGNEAAITTVTTTTTATTTTTTTALTTTTPGSLCDTVVNTFKGVIDTAFDTISGFIPMIPEPIKSLISPIIGTLGDLKNTVYGALKDAGTFTSTAASALSQLIAIATTFKTSITNLIPGVGGLFDLVLNVLSTVASSAQDVATCLGAPKNCNGLLVILGYILKAALPLIKSQVAGLGSLVSGLLGGAIATLESTIDKMISGASDAASSLKGVVDTISGLASFLPAEVKLPLDILKAILDTVDKCNKGL